MKYFITITTALVSVTNALLPATFDQISMMTASPHRAHDQQHQHPLQKTRQELRQEMGGLPESWLLSPKEKQQYIKDAFVFSWEGYRNYSWGYDENRPISNSARNTRYDLSIQGHNPHPLNTCVYIEMVGALLL